MTFKLRSKVIAEFVGTFVLMLAVGLNLSGKTAMSVTSIGFALMVCIYGLADVSGANFNPAVSLCLTISGKLPPLDMALYWLAQCGGALVASGLTGVLCHEEPAALEMSLRSPLCSSLAEVLFTCMLSFVVMNVACAKKNQPNQIYGLAIGLVIVGGGNAGGAVQAGVLNPAVAFGLANSSRQGVPVATLCFFLVAELLGGALAAGLYRYFRPEEFSAPALGAEEEGEAKPDLVRSCLAEFVGTFYLVLTVGLNALSTNTLAAWSIAASLTCMVYCFATVSGAHLNPAVSLAILFREGASPKDTAAYIFAQMLGGMAGALTAVRLAYWHHLSLGLGTGYFMVEGCLAEFLFTLLLTFVVLNVATVEGKSLNEVAGLAVGACVTAGGFAVGRISGASLNPAVSLGLAVVGKVTSGPDNLAMVLVLYVLAECFAAVVAAGVFFAIRAEDPEVSPEDQKEADAALLDTEAPKEEAA